VLKSFYVVQYVNELSMTLDYEPLLAQAEILTLIFRELVERTDAQAKEEEGEATGELRHRRGYKDGEVSEACDPPAPPLEEEKTTTTTVVTAADLPRISDGLRELMK
jgi:hypothetical protein